MLSAFALAFAGAAMIEAAGHFFKLNRSLVAGVRTLIIMTGLWFAVAASRQEEPRKQPVPTALTFETTTSQAGKRT
ncbi:hypothetical protein WHZ77_15420 [Bradyrhizobium sp. A5]|uniref:hypothetical protein n=1 Tax=Bradyrhizobium sp. A5 TaxID=3133696 RepID=UPI0032459C94